MTRYTVDYGIDLGTTNSAIARAEGNDAVIVRDNKQREYTPSAVFVGRTGNIKVGEAARARVEADPDNACSEFKLQMGTPGVHKSFAAAGRDMTPEELSAEVLKSLRGNVGNAEGAEPEAAVVTIPAAFELDQCDATRNAARLAGLSFAPLLQEPTAAAWAYSANHAPSRAFWLVYDFGGGTFDAAVVKVDDGEFTVLNHAGDNFLGGKRVDWALVEDVLIPRVHAELGLTSLSRTNRRAAGNIAKLKAAAEEAKIELSRQDSCDVEVELTTDDGERVTFETELARADVERAATPLIERSIMLSRRALGERGLGAADIERVVLVGGMTQAPLLRQMLADPSVGLGVTLDHSLDPVTVVARGAAIFAGTQQIPRSARPASAPVAGEVQLGLTHATAGPDLDPAVGGTARRDGTTDWTGYTVEFDRPDSRPPWNSGAVPLNADGGFGIRLRAVEGTTTKFTVVLRDPHGSVVPVDQSRLSYRQVAVVGGAPTLSHSIGVGLSDNTVEPLLPKDRELPSRKRLVLHTTQTVSKDSGAGLIRVPILSGEETRADRNTPIGVLELTAQEVARSVPMGSEIEVFIKIDTSFQVKADAYVPLLDEEFTIDVDLHRTDTTTPQRLRVDSEELTDRYHLLRQEVAEVPSPRAREVLDEFDRAETLADVQRLVEQADVDPDAGTACLNRIREANAQLDRVEAAVELPKAIEEARASLTGVEELVSTQGSPRHRTAFREASTDLRAAIDSGDTAMIHRRLAMVRSVGVTVLQDNGQLDAVLFGLLEQELSDVPDTAVQRQLATGRTALMHEDRATLARVVRELREYCDRTQRTLPPADGVGTVTRSV